MAALVNTGNLTVHVASGDALDVREFTVHERMSSLFEVALVVVSDNADIDLEAVVGQAASFTIRHGMSPRTWTGICSELHQLAVEESGLSTYHLSIVPTLWLATQRRNHRMFQQVSEPDIVEKLLGEWGVASEKKLTGTYKKRKYKVQYGETDYTFICRMLEEAGISFYFDGDCKMVLADAPETNDARAPVTFRDSPTVADREHVTNVRVGRRIKPGKHTIRDHDYRKDPAYKLMAQAQTKAAGVEQKLESFHYSPGAFLFGSDKGEDTPFADDKGKTRTDEQEGQTLAQKRLAADRESAGTVEFDTNVLDLSPGVVTSFLDHPRSDLGTGKKLLVVESTLAGRRDEEWSHHCSARSTEQPYHPPVTTPKPKVSGVESATVVGPPGEEIHTDEFGRVRVHFHWDRESKMDDNSSCWIHVSQPWGGAGYGGTNLPRVGQEVIVDFLGGDPDRPIITGRVYTNLQKTPYKLPDNKTQSGWKSNSTNKTGGYNEIMFEDLAGKELMRIQAEKDRHKLVKNDENNTIGRDRTKHVKRDETTNVDHDRTETVGNDETITIGNNRTEKVGTDETITIGHDRTETVKNDETITIEHDRTETVKNDETITVDHDRTKEVKNDETVTIGHDRTETVKNDETITVNHDRTETVKNDEDLTVSHDRSRKVGNNERVQIGQNLSLTVSVNRSARIGTNDTTQVGTKHSVTISDGTAAVMQHDKIELSTPGGAKITLEGSTITLEASNIFVMARDYLGAVSFKDATFGGAANAHLGSAAGPVGITAATALTGHGGAGVGISAGGDVVITGGPWVKINP
jgi:type VI secretion system secreted protein VgrG